MRSFLLVALCLFSRCAFAQAPAAPAAPEKPFKPAPFELEVLAPSLVKAGEKFEIFYRTFPVTSLTLQDEIEDKIEGAKKPAKLQLGGMRLTQQWGRRELALAAPGLHTLTLKFRTGITPQEIATDGTDELLTRSLRVRVLNAAEAKVLDGAEAWDLPEKAIFFTSDANTKWNALPEAARESIALEHPRLLPLKNVPDNGDLWWPLAGWNEWAQVLKREWMPRRETLAGRENAARATRENISYATYERDGTRLLIQSEVGKRMWIYLEQPAAAKPLRVQDVLSDETLAAAKDLKTGVPSILTRSSMRFRSLTQDGAPEAVRVLLISVHQPSQVHLRLPGY